jgi:rare lipoprotein A
MRRLLLLLAMLTAPAQARTVTATVYDPWYNGRADACGGTYHHWDLSAAHRFLPCGARVRVTHKGRSLMVRITDRCDCNSIDLSAGAAYRLGVPLDGVAKVGIEY